MSLFWSFMGDLADWWLSLSFADRSITLAVLLGSPSVWIYEVVRYRRLTKTNPHAVGLAPISVRGGQLEALGPGGVAAALRAELFAINEALLHVVGDRSAPYIAPAIGRDTGYYLVGLRQDAPIPLDVREPEVQKVEQEIVLKVGSVTLPISAIMDAIIAIVGALPVPYRAAYRRSLIQVSLVASDKQTRLTVYRPGSGPAGRSPATADPTVVFTETVPTESLQDIGSVIRDAAFMILEIQGSFAYRWSSMRCLLDGLVALDEYRRTGEKTARDRARGHMRAAAQADPENLEALYFHGVMTMVDQTDGAIDEAIRCFERTFSSASHQLRALVHTGLAYCLAQQWHRLGRRRREVLDRAAVHAVDAEREWAEFQRGAPAGRPPPLHPLIPYTRALVTTVDEGSREPAASRTRRFTDACRLYRTAIDLEPDNGMFRNNLGWVLLKLAESGVAELPPDCRIGGEESRTAHLAEAYLHQALGLNPVNKLTHANLCLLYSVAPYRDEPDEGYFGRCRYHGLKAVRLDPAYVNGYRDLAVALVRYGKLDEAYDYYTRALKLAELPEKDREVIGDLVREVKAHGKLTAAKLARWRVPDPKLLEPAAPEAPSVVPPSVH